MIKQNVALVGINECCSKKKHAQLITVMTCWRSIQKYFNETLRGVSTGLKLLLED